MSNLDPMKEISNKDEDSFLFLTYFLTIDIGIVSRVPNIGDERKICKIV
jgi:hypothetical protein